MHELYTPTPHAAHRMAERNVSADEIANAIGRGIVSVSDRGRACFFDRRTRTVAIVDVRSRAIVTAWRADLPPRNSVASVTSEVG